MRTSYHRPTDSLYVELRPDPAVETREIEDDVMMDIGAYGEPLGYDVQHASTKLTFLRRVLPAGTVEALAGDGLGEPPARRAIG
jgi:uncharacterized protein YuzE